MIFLQGIYWLISNGAHGNQSAWSFRRRSEIALRLNGFSIFVPFEETENSRRW